jgi:hypothetical protein
MFIVGHTPTVSNRRLAWETGSQASVVLGTASVDTLAWVAGKQASEAGTAWVGTQVWAEDRQAWEGTWACKPAWEGNSRILPASYPSVWVCRERLHS